jgi:hypothetical protein
MGYMEGWTKPEQDSAMLLDGWTQSIQHFFDFGSAGGKKNAKNFLDIGEKATS